MGITRDCCLGRALQRRFLERLYTGSRRNQLRAEMRLSQHSGGPFTDGFPSQRPFGESVNQGTLADGQREREDVILILRLQRRALRTFILTLNRGRRLGADQSS